MVRTLLVGLAGLGGLALSAETGELPDLSPEEQAAFLAAFSSVRERLVDCGGIQEVRGVPLRCEARRVPHGRTYVDVAAVETAQLSAEFALSDGWPVKLREKPIRRTRWREEESGELYACGVTAERAAELLAAYFAAIEGRGAPEDGGLDLTSFAACVAPDGEPGRVPPTQTLRGAWPRTYAGFAFRYDRTEVSISAVDGAFVKYNRYWLSQHPPSLDVQISEAEAVSLAFQAAKDQVRHQSTMHLREPRRVVPDGVLLGSKGAYERALEAELERRRKWASGFEPLLAVEPTLESEPGLRIVNPNGQFADRYEDEAWDDWTPESRLAWVVELLLESPTETPDVWQRLHMEVWIDAENGKLLGGHLPY